LICSFAKTHCLLNMIELYDPPPISRDVVVEVYLGQEMSPRLYKQYCTVADRDMPTNLDLFFTCNVDIT
jgi:hypothetical protein